MDSKRLFIGGLYSEIKEEDLRNCFKTFGTVSSVEIIRRADDEGQPLKTFAYLDIIQTETDFRRCVSLLSNSKWKGCCLKVQAAKESFLTRLNKERQEQDQANLDPGIERKEKLPSDEIQPQHVIPEILPKAVPGTPLPGKKNWVVGKFGRVLPVMYLRRRDRKKIAKFDPSKTTHCLKRIKLEETETALSDLTWNLDTELPISDSVSSKTEGKLKLMEDKKRKNLYKNPVEKKSSEGRLQKGRGNSSERNLLASNVSELKSESSDSQSERGRKLVRSSSNKAEILKGQMPFALDSECDVSSSHNAVTIPVLPKKGRDSAELQTMLQNNSVKLLSNVNESKRLSDSKLRRNTIGILGKVSEINGELFAREDNNDPSEERSLTVNERESSDSSDKSSDTSVGGEETVTVESNEGVFGGVHNKGLSGKGRSKVTETRTTYSSDERTDSGYSMAKEETVSRNGDHEAVNKLNSIIPDKTTQSLWTSSEGLSSKLQDDKSKKKLSNDKRLDALFEKKKSTAAQRDLIKDALRNLDSRVQSHDGKKHIVFDNDEGRGSDSDMVNADYSMGEKISGSKASSWLGLNSDSEEDDDQMTDGPDEQDVPLVREKTHFEGKAGEELYKLQRAFGGDKRFELDSRFLEREKENDVDDDDYRHLKNDQVGVKESITTQKEDDISSSLKQEKEMAFKVLSSVLGGDFRAYFGRKEFQEKDSSSFSPVRYDPTREDHKQFERANTEAEKKEKKAQETAAVKKEQPEELVLPEVSQEKYYDVNTSSLADLFGNTNQGTSSFTFLSQESHDDNDSNDVGGSHIGATEELVKNPWQSATKLPYDSSDDSEDDGDDVVAPVLAEHKPLKSSSAPSEELFFFHPDDQQLANRINDDAEPFTRTGSQQDVRAYWLSVRTELTQDYKRKRKDALKWQRKLPARWTRHR